MIMFLVVWLLAALAVVAVVFVVKCLRRRRFCRLDEFHWRGLIVVALIIGSVPAFIHDNQSSRTVQVPDGVAERPKLTLPEKN
ncbi:MAG: hypothetical protein QGG19_16080 [Alphaproteobacteria bacterium]|jgi:beta-lactamase regulating signal transducer with metallopeptidase domain|nr:hypothetical protein [Alphaproteobacteria bacterium]MDP6253894.1 hypothetical protein [Alphaproteobacteria bacterium]MDP7056467.1 hypothetical protein [Alphaproteobacteria bacterium]MDP7230426.1 hypothetical protein [Alphaproteobacteria bacterium]MDP7459004.1 hypothetical protein [Alphaproteobacteria bacterium]|tara:strand:- start:1576 stop:1824 length:249 start_codon:yes stop_codon:yes gene_type:complete